MTPGRKFSTTTSEVVTSRTNAARPFADFRFSVIERLPAFCARKEAPMPRRLSSGSAPSWRAKSPAPGTSTLITSAPSWAS